MFSASAEGRWEAARDREHRGVGGQCGPYWKVTVERLLRLKVELTDSALRRFRKACADAGEGDLARAVEAVAAEAGAGPHLDFNRVSAQVEQASAALGIRMTAKRQKLLASALGEKAAEAAPVIRKAEVLKDLGIELTCSPPIPRSL